MSPTWRPRFELQFRIRNEFFNFFINFYLFSIFFDFPKKNFLSLLQQQSSPRPQNTTSLQQQQQHTLLLNVKTNLTFVYIIIIIIKHYNAVIRIAYTLLLLQLKHNWDDTNPEYCGLSRQCAPPTNKNENKKYKKTKIKSFSCFRKH